MPGGTLIPRGKHPQYQFLMLKPFNDGRDWFFQKRFGMFIHWGLYAIPAWHEQVLWRTRMTRMEYERLTQAFNPQAFDPSAWLDIAQEAGMEYLVITTKHHDGFCLWPSAYTDYHVGNTPYGKDILLELSEECRRRDFLLGFYYSLPDWNHPNYPNSGRHHEMFGPRPTDEPDEKRYLEYVRNQVRELLTGYGSICSFFWDVNVAGFDDPTFNETIRELQPQIMINDRGPSPGDYATPEREVPKGGVFESPTEACQSMGRQSWGYREDEDYYSHRFLMESMDKIFAMGGNYLLNVGPKADGTFPDECIDGLQQIGKWYGKIRESVAEPCSEILASRPRGQYPDNALLTQRENTFYVHLPAASPTTSVVLDCFTQIPESTTLLNDGRVLSAVVETIPWRWTEGPCLCIRGLPVNEILDEVLVIKLDFGEAAAEMSFAHPD